MFPEASVPGKMIIDISTIDDTALPFEFSQESADIDLDSPGVALVGQVLVVGEITKYIERFAVEGTITGAWELDCSRCLQPLSRPLSLTFNVDYVTEGAPGTASEIELKAEDLDVDELLESELDLTQLAREQILLNLPEQIYCREDCKGLCEKCGENRNLLDCKCEQTEIDPRWAALKNLKDNLN